MAKKKRRQSICPAAISYLGITLLACTIFMVCHSPAYAQENLPQNILPQPMQPEESSWKEPTQRIVPAQEAVPEEMQENDLQQIKDQGEALAEKLADEPIPQGQVQEASFSTGLAIDLSMTATNYNITNGGGDSMNVNNFDLNGGGPTTTITLTVNPQNFPMGATLTVGAGQAAGTYIGTFAVNANYQ